MKEIKQYDFSGGISEHPRDVSNTCSYCENVILERGVVSQVCNVDTANSQSHNTGRCITKLLQVGSTIYGLGQDSVANKDISLYSKTIGSSNNWSLLTDGTITGTLFTGNNDPFFVYYEGALYFNGETSYIGKYSGTTMTKNFQALTGGLFGGLVWQGNMYGYQGQKIYKLTTAPSVTEMISIPSGQTIVQMLDFGNYMAIICSANDGGISKMYLWDGVTTTTFTEIVEIGRGNVTGGNMLDGTICVVIGLPNYKGFRIMAYSGGVFKSIVTYNGRLNGAATRYNYILPASTVKKTINAIYFLASGARPNSTFAQTYEPLLFKFGKTNDTEQNALSVFKTLYPGDGSNTILTSGNDFLILESEVNTNAQTQGLAAVIYSLDDGAYTSSYYETKLNTFGATENTTSSASGVIETVLFNGGDPHKQKTLKGIALTYDPLPTAGQVVLKYRKDEETTWTTIWTDTTDNAVSHATTQIETGGANLPIFKEIQFRIELSGNAKLTGLKFRYEELNDENY